MITPTEAVQALNSWRSARPPIRSTSFAAIDRVTGGFVLGRVWIVTGTPGQGRSCLAVQWALQLATQQGLRTDLVSVKEPEHLVAARLLGSAGKLPVSGLLAHGIEAHDELKLSRAQELLAEAPMRICGPGGPSVLTFEPPITELPEALIVDDVDLAPGASPGRLAGLRDRNVLVIVTLPKHLVVADNGLNPDWTQVADYIIDIERPDLLDPQSLRPGEADLHLLRNRWGPQLTDSVAFQGHYARFVEKPS